MHTYLLYTLCYYVLCALSSVLGAENTAVQNRIYNLVGKLDN